MNNGQEMDDAKVQRIAYLIAGFIRQTLTPEEHDELDRWVEESDENMLLFEELTDEENIEAGLEAMKSGNTALAYKKIRSKLPFQKKRKTKVLWAYGLAASVILIVIVGYFFIPFKKTVNQPSTAVKQKDVEPGSDKAVLTLSDGRVIILSNEANGSIVTDKGIQVVKLDSGSIAYSSTDTTRFGGFNKLSTPRGGQYQVTLSDGTKVWLNAVSSLQYPVVFDSKERRVELEGEAYFEVAHDTTRPFHVISKNQDIAVLGTKFNVTAYSEDGMIMTTLLEGKIQLSTQNQRTIVLPGEQFFTEGSGVIKRNPSPDMNGSIAWKEGVFHFRNASIEEILKQVSRWYDVEIIYEGKIQEHFNAEISRKLPVSKLLNLLEKTGGVHFEIEGKKIKVKK